MRKMMADKALVCFFFFLLKKKVQSPIPPTTVPLKNRKEKKKEERGRGLAMMDVSTPGFIGSRSRYAYLSS